MLKQVSLICLCLILSLSLGVGFSNSGPVTWEAWPAYELTIESEHSIGVEKEKLTFELFEKGSGHTVDASVRAEYHMISSNDSIEQVTFFFPMISNFIKASSAVAVTMDGKDLPFEIFLGPSQLNKGDETDLSFETLIERIVNEKKPTETVYRYEINDANGLQNTLRYAYSENSKIIVPLGLKAYGHEEGTSFFIVSDEHTLIFFVLGEPLDLLEPTAESFTISEIALNDLIDYIAKTPSNYALDDFFSVETINEGIKNAIIQKSNALYPEVFEFDDIWSYFFHERYIGLLFKYDFKPDTTHVLTVNYQMSGAMDRRNSYEPIYTFKYFLSPAKHWRYFKALDIEIMTTDELPFVIDSNLALDSVSKKYFAHFNGIPDDRFVFSVYSRPEINWIEKNIAPISRNAPYFLYILFPVLALFLTAFGVAYFLKNYYQKPK